MILTNDQILGLLDKPANAEMLQRARVLLGQHQLHIKGDGLMEYLSKVETFENDTQLALRRKFAKALTVPILAPELNTFNAVFSAQGGSSYYQFSNDKLKADFTHFLGTDVGDGFSMREWMEEIWLDKVNYDMTGVLMVELPKEINKGNIKPYVTWRSVMDMHDVGFTGKRIEYVIFVSLVQEKDQTVTRYRIVDDERDVIVDRKVRASEDGKGTETYYTFVKDLEIPNFWKYVPAIFMSNQRDSRTQARQSYIWQAIGVLDELVVDASIHSISKKLNAFPIKWMRKRVCGTCGGRCQVINPRVQELHADNLAIPDDVAPMIPCHSCSGTGSVVKVDVSDVIQVPTMNSKEDVDNLPVAGYVTPPIETLKEQRDEMMWLTYIVHKGIWAEENGQSLNSDGPTGSQKTATEDNNDVAAIYTKLNKVSKNGEQVERFLIDALGKARYGDAYQGCLINYGRRYALGNVDEIEQTYTAAKDAGLASHILDAYLDDLICVKFAHDPMEREVQLKLSTLEPFVHMTAEQVKTLGVSRKDYLMKVYFNDYIERFEREVMPVAMASGDEIMKKLNDYNQEQLDSERTNNSDQATAQLQLRGTVGGIDGIIKMNQAVGDGSMTREAAVNVLVNSYGYEASIAESMISKGDVKPPPPPVPPTGPPTAPPPPPPVV